MNRRRVVRKMQIQTADSQTCRLTDWNTNRQKRQNGQVDKQTNRRTEQTNDGLCDAVYWYSRHAHVHGFSDDISSNSEKNVNAEILLNKSSKTLKFHQYCLKRCETLVSTTSLHNLPFRWTLSILQFFPRRLFVLISGSTIFSILFIIFYFFPNIKNYWLPDNGQRAL